MANLTITIPDAVMPRVQAAVAATQGYQPQITDPQDPTKTITNPETIAQFTQRLVRDYLKNITAAYEAGLAQIAEQNKVKGEFGP